MTTPRPFAPMYITSNSTDTHTLTVVNPGDSTHTYIQLVDDKNIISMPLTDEQTIQLARRLLEGIPQQ